MDNVDLIKVSPYLRYSFIKRGVWNRCANPRLLIRLAHRGTRVLRQPKDELSFDQQDQPGNKMHQDMLSPALDQSLLKTWNEKQ